MMYMLTGNNVYINETYITRYPVLTKRSYIAGWRMIKISSINNNGFIKCLNDVK